MNEIKVYPVIIIGAGISGLAAANTFQKHGIEFMILEAKSKPGGRIETHNLPSIGRLELGAQWIHGEENDLCHLAKEKGHIHDKTSWEGEGEFLLPNGTRADSSTVSEILEWIANTIGYVEDTFCIEELQNNPSKYRKQSLDSNSMGAFLKQRFDQYLQDAGVGQSSMEYDLKMAVFQWGMSFQRIDNSCNFMKDLSLFRWSEFQVNPGEHYNNFKHGASIFVDQVLVKTLPNGSIMCNSPVENVHWVGNGVNHVTIRVRGGQKYYTKCVLVTPSIGVLKHNQNLFTPELPGSLKNAIKATGFGPICKVYLTWDKPWWPSDLKGFQFLWPKEYTDCCEGRVPSQDSLNTFWFKSFTGFDPVLDSPRTLVGWLGGPEAVYAETLSEQEVGETLAKVLAKFTGYQVPRPTSVVVSKWCSDEFIRGAYSYRSTAGDHVQEDITAALAKPVTQWDALGNKKPVIVLAGEALSKTHYSTIHGAYESGQTQAAKIIDYYNKLEAQSKKNNTQVVSNVGIQGVLESMEIAEISQLTTELQLVCQLSQHLNIQT